MTLVTPTRYFDAQGNLKPLVETDQTDLLMKPCGALHNSPHYGGNLMIVHRHFAHNAYAEAVRDGRARAICAWLTADGRHVHQPLAWATGDGESAAGGVYFEKHAECGRVLHGWIDAESRKLVQIG